MEQEWSQEVGRPHVFPPQVGKGSQPKKKAEPMNDAGVRSSGSTCGKRPGEADDRTVQSTKETSASTINWGIAMPTSLWAIADKARADKQHRLAFFLVGD